MPLFNGNLGPGPMWQFSDFYFQAGVAQKILGISNVVANSKIWVYTLDVLSGAMGIPFGIVSPLALSMHRTTSPLGGGPSGVVMNIRSDYGANPADLRYPPAAPVNDPGQGLVEFAPQVIESGPGLPAAYIEIPPMQRTKCIYENAPIVLLPGEGIILEDLGSSSDPVFGATIVLLWGAE